MHVSEDEIKRLAIDLVISGMSPKVAWKTAREFADLKDDESCQQDDKKIGF